MFTFDDVVTFLQGNSHLILAGILDTVILALFGTFVGLVLGVFIAYGKNITINETDKKITKILKWIAKGFCIVYSTVVRGTPMMVQALIFKFGCSAIGIDWGSIVFPSWISDYLNGWFIAGIIVITLNTAAYMGEVVRTGLNGVDKGQIEGAQSLGMSSARTSFSIVLPQALRNALPAIGNELIVNIKDSSVLNVIAVTELYYRMMIIASSTYKYLLAYLLLAIIYLLLTLIAGLILKLIEKKLDGVKFSLNPFRSWKMKKVF